MKRSNLFYPVLVALLLFGQQVLAQAPVISTISIDTGKVGTSVTLTGSNFGSTTGNNVVYFGATKGVVTAAGATSVTVKVDTGANYAPISLLNTTTGLQCHKDTGYFTPTFMNYYFIQGIFHSLRLLNMGTQAPPSSNPVFSQPITAAIGDLNGDGKPDLAVNCAGRDLNTGGIIVCRNLTSPGDIITASSFDTLRLYTAALGATPTNIKMGDIDGDGKLDLIFSLKGSRRIGVFRNTSTSSAITFDAGTFFLSPYCKGPSVLALADFNGDGKLDIAVSSVDTSNFVVFTNRSSVGTINTASLDSGTSFTVGSFNLGMCTADFDGDGKPDIAIVDSNRDKLYILRNTSASGGLSFASPASYNTARAPIDVQTADIDGDGKLDLVMAALLADSMSVFQNFSSSGSISFGGRVNFRGGTFPVGIAAADFDGDGRVDITMSNAADGTVSIYRNNNISGTITTASLTNVGGNPQIGLGPAGVTACDLNGDGYPEIVTGNIGNGTIGILQNYPLPYVANIIGDTSICLSAGSTDYLDSTSGGEWTISNGALATINIGTGHLTVIAAGRDTIYYKITAGGDTNRVMLPINILPNTRVATITGSTTGCPGAHLAYSDTVTGGRWSSSNTSVATIDSVTGAAIASATGTTNISYSFTNSCGTARTALTLTVSTSTTVPAIAGPAGSICPGSSVTFTDSLTGGSWTTSNAAVASVNSGGLVTGVSNGYATIVYSVATSCGTSSASRLVSVTATPVAGVVAGAVAICQGATTTYSDTASGGIWSSANLAVATVDSATGLVTGVSRGSANITYTVRSSCGSSATAFKTIDILGLPVAGRPISGPAGICLGFRVNLTDTSTTGIWSSATPAIATIGAATGRVTPIMTGTATFRYAVTNSCGSDTAFYSMSVDSTPVAGVVSGPYNLCMGTPVTYTTTGSHGTWRSSNTGVVTISSFGVATPVASGTAVISYIDSNSCGVASDTVNVTVNPVPAAGTISGATTLCAGRTSSFTETGSGGSWSSTNTALATVNAATGLVQALSATGGVDTIKYTTSNSCGTVVDMFALTINPAATAGVIAGHDSVCAGSTTTLTDTASGGTWSISPSSIATIDATTGLAGGVAAGTATVTYTRSSSCGATGITAPFYVLTTPTPAISGPASNDICLHAQAVASATPIGGVWRRTLTNISLSAPGVSGAHDTVVVTGAVVGSDTLTYVVTNICATATSNKIIYQVRALPDTGTITGPANLCRGATVTLTESATGGNWGITGSGSPRAFIDGSGNITGISSGVATVTYSNTSVYCGTNNATLYINVLDSPNAGTVTTPLDTLCPGSTVTLTDAGGSPGIYWLSSDTTVATIGLLTGDVTARVVGSVNLMAIDTGSGYCGMSTSSVNIVVRNGAPYAGIISGIDSVCAGATAVFTESITGGVWSVSNVAVGTVDTTGTVVTNAGGVDSVYYTVSDACGATRASKRLRVYGIPNLSSGVTPSAICDSSLFTYTATSDSTPVSFTWMRNVVTGLSNGADSGTNTISEHLSNNTSAEVFAKYYFTANYFGCISRDTVTLGVNPSPTLTSGFVDSACSGSPFIYNYTTNTGTGSSATWSVITSGNAVPSVLSGTENIHDILTDTSGSPTFVVFRYHLLYNGCTNTEDVAVKVNPSPGSPRITTHSSASVCEQAFDFNFGADVAPPAGTTYAWSADNAEIFATGSTRQYCLVNFKTPGVATITLSAVVPGTNCGTSTSYIVSVGNQAADNPYVIYFNDRFICETNTAESYQWGYDDAFTLDSTILPGQTNQDYVNTNIDLTNKLYWVITNHNGCMQKSYYNPPTAIANVTASTDGNLTIVPNPNNGTFELNLASKDREAMQVVVTDVLGKVVYETRGYSNKPIDMNLDQPAGVYLVTAVSASGRHNAKFVIAK